MKTVIKRNVSEVRDSTRSEGKFLFVLLTAVSIAFVWVLLPFYGAIMWGLVIALLFAPLNCRLLRRLNKQRTLAAVLTLMIVLIIAIIPFALISASLGVTVDGVEQPDKAIRLVDDRQEHRATVTVIAPVTSGV